MGGTQTARRSNSFLFGKKTETDTEKRGFITTAQAGHVSRLVNLEMQPEIVDGKPVLRYEYNGRRCRGEVLSVGSSSPKDYFGSVRVVYENGKSEVRKYTARVVRLLKSLEIGELTDRVLQ